MPDSGEPGGEDGTPVLIALEFRRPDIGRLRQRVAACAGEAGLRGQRLQAFVMAVNEIITNAVLHGGGRGRLRLWRGDRQLVCEVSDRGPGIPGERTAAGRPPPEATSGRGLWLTRRLCDAFTVETGRNGTTVRVAAVLEG
jgi:serine/threonine-protein kinase RsbW